MSHKSCTGRLKQDYIRIMKDPIPYVKAHPLPSNMLEWHFALLGPEETPYEGGVYHGKLVFPSAYPFKPPEIYMITPNGRFRCNTRLWPCMGDMHPETYNWLFWSVDTILTGLFSCMVRKNLIVGSIKTSNHQKRILASKSLEFNLKDAIFCELFPDLVEECKAKLSALKNQNSRASGGSSDSNSDSQNLQFQKG